MKLDEPQQSQCRLRERRGGRTSYRVCSWLSGSCLRERKKRAGRFRPALDTYQRLLNPGLVLLNQRHLDPALARSGFHLDEAVFLSADDDHLIRAAERLDDLARVAWRRIHLHAGDLRRERIALVERRTGLPRAATCRFLLQRADVSLQSRIAADDGDDFVV